jgi:hypothetical protein
MDPVSLTVGVSWAAAGLACIGLAVPLARGRVRRNPLYGVRFPESLQSDEAWYAINRFGGRRMIGWSVPLVVVGAVSLFLPLRAHPALALVLGFGPLVFILIPLVESYRFARRYGRQR